MIIIVFLLACIGQIFGNSDDALELEMIIHGSEKDFIDLSQNRSSSPSNSPLLSRPYGAFSLPLKEGHLFLEGEYLYWKPYAFIPYAIKNTTVGSNFSTNYENPQVNLKAHFGFRGTLGIYLPEPTWYLTGSYTQFMSQGSDFISTEGQASNQVPLSNIWTAVAPVSSVNNGPRQASATEKIFYRNVDALLNKTFVCSSCFNLDTFFGARYSKINIGMNILYSEQEVTSGQFGKVAVSLNNNFNAVGINAGFLGNWQLGSGFEIFGKASLSSLVGRFLLRVRQQVFRPSFGELVLTLTDANKLRDIYTTGQLALGLIWGAFFKKNVYMGFKAGYELNVWPGLIRIQEIPNFTPQVRPAIIFKNFFSMQGLTASIKFDF